MGFPEETIAEIEQAQTESEVEIWPENWDIVTAFSAISTQWRITSLAGGRIHYSGLDYSAAKAGLELAGTHLSVDLWSGIRIMERAAMAALNTSR